MDNVFDTMKANTFDCIATTMGYDAIWYPDGNPESEGQAARVLFNDPSTKEEVGTHDYDPTRPTLEYKEGDWIGLKALVDAKSTELIKVRGVYYFIYKIEGEKGIAKDGENYRAILETADL